MRRWVYDRGQRPAMRGWFHLVAAWLSVVSGSVLATYGFMVLPWQQGIGVLVYALGVVGLFGVSAAYHRGPWKSLSAINWWRRADHSMIAVFIAATYTPLCLIALPGNWWILTASWVGAAGAVVLNMWWIEHPRWLDVVVYLALGWLTVPLIPQLWVTAGPAVVWLLFAGGIVYTVGALFYGLQWPGKRAKILGFHEVFHLATVIAAIIHLVAVWIVVAGH
ncbi:hemolysin III family protein [Corynebacterium sp. 35RC1]|nr:hemolysin III family protein [Corynebacterium sp. 35RC1]